MNQKDLLAYNQAPNWQPLSSPIKTNPIGKDRWGKEVARYKALLESREDRPASDPPLP